MSSPSRRDWQRQVIEAHRQRERDRKARKYVASPAGSLRRAEPEPAAPPPVFSEAVVGFRVWKIDAFGRLRPQSIDHAPWQPGVNTAVCRRVEHEATYYSLYELQPAPAPAVRHSAPHHECACGLYARFGHEALMDYTLPSMDEMLMPLVAGSVVGWGNMEVHRSGFRAQHAQVTALALHPNMPAPVAELVERVAEAYGVPAVADHVLPAEAGLHGAPLPAEALPADPMLTLHDEFLRSAAQLAHVGRQLRTWGTWVQGP